jgi:Calcineurin-like phosphoesterase
MRAGRNRQTCLRRVGPGVSDGYVVSSTAPKLPSTGDHAAEARLATVIDLLFVVSYIDGQIEPTERAFIQQYIDSIVWNTGQSASAPNAAEAQSARLRDLSAQLEAEVASIAFVGAAAVAPLRQRALLRFGALAVHDQATALELTTGLLHADGTVTALEQEIYADLMAAFVASSERSHPTTVPHAATTLKGAARAPMLLAPTTWRELMSYSHPLLDPVEQTFSPHPIERQAQIQWDFKLLQNAILQWQRLRTVGASRLAGITDVGQLPTGTSFLDNFVHVIRPAKQLELIVLGDLHGCYSCLKAALLQSNFIERAWAHQWDPERYPEVKLVMLGDYIDRGRFSFDGVMRAALHLFASIPEHVILLRGNHEWFRWFNNSIASGVYPAEGIASIAPYVSIDMLEAYRQLFEHMPTSLLCDRTLYVHAGIPRDDTFAERYRDLSSLNDADLRFQMMWSDPVAEDSIPVEMQRLNPRFSFGRSQFKNFMQRVGMNVMVRGHEQVERGFEPFFDLGEHMLLDLFSAGGFDNDDLPIDSSYRGVTPMALTVQYMPDKAPVVTPWPIHYRPFNFAPHNGLYRPQPLLEYRYG